MRKDDEWRQKLIKPPCRNVSCPAWRYKSKKYPLGCMQPASVFALCNIYQESNHYLDIMEIVMESLSRIDREQSLLSDHIIKGDGTSAKDKMGSDRNEDPKTYNRAERVETDNSKWVRKMEMMRRAVGFDRSPFRCQNFYVVDVVDSDDLLWCELVDGGFAVANGITGGQREYSVTQKGLNLIGDDRRSR